MTGLAQLELDWLGGPAEARLRRRRPGLDALPWGTLAGALPPADEAAARAAWTDGTFTEYASAAAFSALAAALLEAGAPVDLTAMAADCVVDELTHVELGARVAAELGGAAAYEVDLARVAPWVDPALPATERAVELAVTTCCIGEALSVPVLVGSMRAAAHPLTRAVLTRIVRDEGPHARLGWIVLDWARARPGGIDRARLAEVAAARIADYAPLWEARPCADPGEAYRATAGRMREEAHRATLRRTLAEDVLAPLAARGIVVTPPAAGARGICGI